MAVTASNSDAILARALSVGEDRAFELLYARHTPRMRATAAALVKGTGIDADDVVQDAWLRAHAALLRGVAVTELGPWLRVIVRHRCFDLLQALALQTTTSDDALLSIGDEAADAPVRRRELLRELIEDVQTLEPRQREALTRYALAGESQQEIATALGATTSGVKSLVHRGRRNLRRRMEARSAPCADVRAVLGVARHRGTRPPEHVRRHLQVCGSCRAHDRRRGRLAAWLPATPWVIKSKLSLAAVGIMLATGTAAAITVERTTYREPIAAPNVPTWKLPPGHAFVRNDVTLHAEPRDAPLRRLRVSCPAGYRLWQYDVAGQAKPLPLPSGAAWIGRQAATLTYPAPARDITGTLWAMCQRESILRRMLAHEPRLLANLDRP
jgi:RNA polymerase sigma-70 factor, ECF subfamily